MKRFWLFLIGLCLLGQDPEVTSKFIVYKSTALSGAAEVLTLQHTASASKTFMLKQAYIYCSVACTVALERNGTAPTTTSTSIVNINSTTTGVSATQAAAYHTSNVGSGTVLITYSLGAGSGMVLDLSNMQLPSATADNVTLRTSSITGTAVLGIIWKEQ